MDGQQRKKLENELAILETIEKVSPPFLGLLLICVEVDDRLWVRYPAAENYFKNIFPYTKKDEAILFAKEDIEQYLAEKEGAKTFISYAKETTLNNRNPSPVIMPDNNKN